MLRRVFVKLVNRRTHLGWHSVVSVADAVTFNVLLTVVIADVPRGPPARTHVMPLGTPHRGLAPITREQRPRGGHHDWTHWRVRVLLYAGRPDWSKLATITPAAPGTSEEPPCCGLSSQRLHSPRRWERAAQPET
jgi:hypothetical protein